jgi:uncharacterized protein YkwD
MSIKRFTPVAQSFVVLGAFLVIWVWLTTPGLAKSYGGGIRSSQTLETEVTRLTNLQRQQFSLGPCQPMGKIALAARGHSAEMIQLSYFEHVSPTPGQTHPADRLQLVGISSEHYAENIYSAEGYPLAEVARECVRDWMNSPHHRANILDAANVCIGVGVALHVSASGGGLEVLVTEDFTGAVEADDAGNPSP